MKISLIASIILITTFPIFSNALEKNNSTDSKFTENSITFKSGQLMLFGTLTTPNQKNGVPGVLLIPGSGPTDRDGNQPGLQTNLLKQIAQNLAENGVASLRFDKRATKTYQMLWPTDPKKLNDFFSWNNFEQDIRAAFSALKNTAGVNPKNCSLLGHSEGDVFAIDLATELKPASLILMATPGRTLSEVLKDQVSALLENQKATPDQKKYYLAELSRIIDVVEKTGAVPNDVPAGLKALFPSSAGLFLQKELGLDPSKKISFYSGPVIVMNGLSDIQVNPKLDADRIYQTAHKRPKGVAEIHLFPSLSHNFKAVSSTADQGFTGQVSPEVLSTLNEWMRFLSTHSRE
jgi:hypothetical protein